MRLRVFTAFSGYDPQCMALDRAGNSITVDVMVHMFRNLFATTEEGLEEQLQLF